MTIFYFSQDTELHFGDYGLVDTAKYDTIILYNEIFVANSEGVKHPDYLFAGDILKVNQVTGTGKILKGGKLDDKAIELIKQSKKRDITFVVDYIGPDKISRKGGLHFFVE